MCEIISCSDNAAASSINCISNFEFEADAMHDLEALVGKSSKEIKLLEEEMEKLRVERSILRDKIIVIRNENKQGHTMSFSSINY